MGHGHGRRELAERLDGRIDLAGYPSTPTPATLARPLLRSTIGSAAREQVGEVLYPDPGG